MLRLHYHPLSPYSRKAAVAVALRGDEVSLRVVDVFRGEHRGEAFRALSPFGKMPVLETDEGAVIESTSIIEYLEERGPRILLPPGRERLARYFDRIADLYLMENVAKLWWEPQSDAAKAAPDVALRAWAMFSVPLAKSAFVTGDAFTLGDLSAAIATDYFLRLGLDVPGAIRAWRDRCFAIPEMKASLEEALPFVAQTLGSRARAI